MIWFMSSGHIGFEFRFFIITFRTKIEIEAIFAFENGSFEQIHFTKGTFDAFFLGIIIRLDFYLHLMIRLMVFRIDEFAIVLYEKAALA